MIEQLEVIPINESNIKIAVRCVICEEIAQEYEHQYAIPNHPLVCANCKRAIMWARAKEEMTHDGTA